MTDQCPECGNDMHDDVEEDMDGEEVQVIVCGECNYTEEV